MIALKIIKFKSERRKDSTGIKWVTRVIMSDLEEGIISEIPTTITALIVYISNNSRN